ncbi:hypothetical protein Vau01_060760 [Virgisporangium aurantiacum]|uniref:Adhesin domain-containing protein n=2 Tax=Virgisporangium aurantiacum TaxID=175570 RepID=A0A8J3ZB76_9ACTN|nr:hypothetical protein Vau01_060760 [Virgisporangium aurantiacum]
MFRGEAESVMASTPVESGLVPQTGDSQSEPADSQSEPATIVPQYRNPDGADEDPPPDRRRFPVVGLLIAVALAAIVVLVTVTFARIIDPPPEPDTRPSAQPRPQYTVSAPVGATTAAEFQLVEGVTAIVVRAADLGTDLYRASTPDGAGSVPRVAQEGDQVKLRLTSLYETDAPDTVTVELNQRVRWRITLVAGTETATVDMRNAALAGVDFTGGAARIEVFLPKPQGDVTVRMAGGVRDFAVHAPRNVPVRVALARGAATVTVDGTTRSGVAAGTRIVPTGWDAARDRYVIDAVAGLGTLTVTR